MRWGRVWDHRSPSEIKSVPCAARPGSSFLLVQERRNQKEDAPALALSAHPCADETMADIVSATLRAIPPPCTATQGTTTAAGIVPLEQSSGLRCAHEFHLEQSAAVL